MQRPWISTNLAISADGKITSVARQPSGWTSAEDHARLLDLRQSADALMVGRGTLEADRMTLTVPGKSIQPLRCIVSRTGEIPPDHPVFHQPGGQIHLLATENPTPSDYPGVIRHRGSLADFLETLAANHQVKHLHCEGGGSLIRALAELDAIDEFHLTLAGHTLFGGADGPDRHRRPRGFPARSRGLRNQPLRSAAGIRRMFSQLPPPHSVSGLFLMLALGIRLAVGIRGWPWLLS